MALTYAKVKEEADAAKALSEELGSLLLRLHQFLEHNSDLAIDWPAAVKPGYISEDADQNLLGYTFSRQEVSNVIGSFDQVRRLLTNLTATQGDHLGNVNKLARPLG